MFFLVSIGLETIFQKAQGETTFTAVLIFFAIIKIFGHQSVLLIDPLMFCDRLSF